MNRYSKIIHHLKENPETPKSSQRKKRTFAEYEADQKKKTSSKAMPPRGDKRREDFEKWYAKNVR